MAHRARALLVAAALLVLPALAPAAQACFGVPCGRIYPVILIKIPDQEPVYDVEVGVPLVLDATLTFTFDMDAEGYTVTGPNEQIVIHFEYPRKPRWADIAVEPPQIVVPVEDPRYVQPSTEAGGAQAQFVFTVPIQITATVTGQAILRDGYDYAKLLVFAKSSESGLYQSGYGIKEVRIAPEGALHESDVAGSRDVYAVSPLPQLDLQPVEAVVAGVRATLTPGTGAQFWQPTPLGFELDPPPAGRVHLAIHDERGDLVAQRGPLERGAPLEMNATFVRPGLHTATLTLLDDGTGAAPPIVLALPFQAGEVSAEGHAFPKSLVATTTEAIPTPTASQADALVQFERDMPFFAFDKAQSVTAMVALVTPGVGPLSTGLANLQFEVVDPEGNVLNAGTVDPQPASAVKSFRVGSLPLDGWYVLRVKGTGAPMGAAYTARVEVNYAVPLDARNLADGAPDATGGLLGLGGGNVTLPIDALAVWAPTPFTPVREGAERAQYAMTIYDENGTLAYATGLREGSATFSAPAPGTYRAYVFVEPVAPSAAFPPVSRAFTFDVGTNGTTTATAFEIDDVHVAATSPASTPVVGIYQVRILEAGAAVEGADLAWTDAEGQPAEPTTPGTYLAFARRSGEGNVAVRVAYDAPVTLTGPDAQPQAQPAPESSVPSLAAVTVLAALGAVAVAAALLRRRA